MKDLKESLARSLKAVADAADGVPSHPAIRKASDADGKARLVKALESALEDAKSGRMTHAVVVGLGPAGAYEACCVRGDKAARMVGMLEVTKSRLVSAMAAMSEEGDGKP